ncbi:hypothetical protein SBA4_4650016 [Candidatus Sulfopaludibacter sp. SbA4]|nr:hypothetical protein SBA4_4650016 [Candidatus Sulfopaludibacter sp. SbA4]
MGLVILRIASSSDAYLQETFDLWPLQVLPLPARRGGVPLAKPLEFTMTSEFALIERRGESHLLGASCRRRARMG